MKSWLLYFLAFAAAIGAVPAVGGLYGEDERSVLISVKRSDGVIESVGIEEFVAAVICSEYGEVNEPEAAKALAVAVRSAALYVDLHGCRHGDCDFCDSPDCCFLFLPLESYPAETARFAVEAAKSTEGGIITYRGEPAMALITLCSGTGTRTCCEYPYITGVKRETECEKHKTVKTFTVAELEKAFGGAKEESDVCIVSGENGYCEFMVVDGRMIGGGEAAEMLGLTSANFTADRDGDGNVVFVCRGAGSGYGLDLCEAEALARAGSGYKSIIGRAFPESEICENY